MTNDELTTSTREATPRDVVAPRDVSAPASKNQLEIGRAHV